MELAQHAPEAAEVEVVTVQAARQVQAAAEPVVLGTVQPEELTREAEQVARNLMIQLRLTRQKLEDLELLSSLTQTHSQRQHLLI